MRKASIAAIAAVALVVAAFVGSGVASSSHKTATTIKVWAHQGQAGEVATLQKAIKGFNASQSDIKATLQLIPEADYTKTVSATQPSGLPDVLEYDGPLMSGFVYSKKLQTINGQVAGSTVSNQTSSVRAQNTYGDGKLYGVSMFDSGLALYGNKALLKAAGVKYPTTWPKAWTASQFTAALAKLSAKDKDKKVLDIKENYAGEWPSYGFLPIVYSTGTPVVKDHKASGSLDSDKVVAAVKTFAGWRKYVDANSDDKAFITKRVALSWVGHWVYPDYSKALGKNLVLIPLPNFGNGAKSGQGSWAWGIGAKSQNAKAAGTFLDYLVNDANVKGMTTANGAPPGTTTGVAADKLYKQGGPLALYAAGLKATCGTKSLTSTCVATPRPVTAAYATISKEFSTAFFNAYRGGDAKSLLSKAAKAIDLDYADNSNYGEK